MLTPPFPLRPNAQYFVTLPRGLLRGRRSGTVMAADLSYWFFTSEPT